MDLRGEVTGKGTRRSEDRKLWSGCNAEKKSKIFFIE